MDIFKICGLSICGCVLVLVLKEQKNTFGTVLTLMLSVVLLMLFLPHLASAIQMLRDLYERLGDGSSYFDILLKIIGVSVVGQIAADVCKDAGLTSLAGTVLLLGRGISLGICLPAVGTLLSLIDSLLPT